VPFRQHHRLLPALLVLLLPAMANSAELDNLPEQRADVDRAMPGEPRPPQFLVGSLGIALVNTGRFVGSDERVTLPLPLLYFNYNDRLYWSITSVGTWLWRSDDRLFRIGLLAKARGRVQGDDTPYAGIFDRDPSVDAGLNVLWQLHPLLVGASWYGDALGRSHGQNANLRLTLPIHLGGRWVTTPSVIAEWQDEKLVDYYYGVTPAETGGGASTYVGSATLNLRAGWSLGYRISRQWTVLGGVSYTRLGDGIADSPLVSHHSNLLAYLAVNWRFFIRNEHRNLQDSGRN